MADSDIILKIGSDTAQIKKDLDDLKNHLDNKKIGDKAGDAMGSSFAMNVIAINQGFELIGKAARAVAATVEKAFDLAIQGEEIIAIGTRFEVLANQAGLIPENISSGIEKAVHGTVDMEDALKAAGGAIVSLGTNAERIPQLFDMAKKATALFGGDTVQRFEEISQAIASGSTRQLRQIGIIVDSNKAYKDYADSIGSSVEVLSSAQKQQAMMNAVLDQGKEKFKNISSSITPLSEEVKKLGVAYNEVGDSIALVINQKIGPALATFTSAWSMALNNAASKIKEVFLGEVPAIDEQVSRTRAAIIDLQNLKQFDPLSFNAQNKQAELDKLNEQYVIQSQLQMQEQEKASADEASISRTNAKADSQARTNEEIKQELELLRSAQGEYQKIQDAASTFQNFSAGFTSGMKEMSMTTMQLGKQIAGTMKQGFTNAMGAVGAALVKGEDALQAFGKAMLGTLGELAMQFGSFFIAQGIGYIAGGNYGMGFALLAAGAGITVLGGALKALAGGGGGSGSAAGASAPPDTSYSPDLGNQLTQEQEREKAQTGVTVQVMGNVYNQRETALEIATILNDSFDLNGTLIRANA